MDTITGEILKIHIKENEGTGRAWKKTSAKIGEEWYATFDQKLNKFTEGDTVKVEYVVNDKGFHDISSITPADGSQAEEAAAALNEAHPSAEGEKPRFTAAKAAGVSESLRDLRIARQCAIKATVELGGSLDDMLKSAQRITDFIMSPPTTARPADPAEQKEPFLTAAEMKPVEVKEFTPNEGWEMPTGEKLSKNTKHDILTAFGSYGIKAGELEKISGIPFGEWAENTRLRALNDYGALEQSLITSTELLNQAERNNNNEPIPF